MQTSEQSRREQAGERMITMAAEAYNVDQELENLDGVVTKKSCIADFKKLTKDDRTINIRYKSAREIYGEEAIRAGDIVKYLMNDKNGVVNKENVFEAIDMLELEATLKRQDTIQARFQNRSSIVNLDDVQLQESPSQVTHQARTTINQPGIVANSVVVNERNVKCGCSIF